MNESKFKVFKVIASDSNKHPSIGLIIGGILLFGIGIGVFIIPFTLGQAEHFNHKFDWFIFILGGVSCLAAIYCWLWCIMECKYLKKLFLRSKVYECNLLAKYKKFEEGSDGGGGFYYSIKFSYMRDEETFERKTKYIFTKRQVKKIGAINKLRMYYDAQKDEAMYLYY